MTMTSRKPPHHPPRAEPLSISANAINAQTTFKATAAALNLSGHIPDTDFRLRENPQDIYRQLPDLAPDRLDDIHERVRKAHSDLKASSPSDAREMMSLVSCHAKITNTLKSGRIDQGKGLGLLATAGEQIAVSLSTSPSQSLHRMGVDILSRSADCCDKATLSLLHRDYTGLVTPISTMANQSMFQTVHDLWRNGKIASDDLRRNLDPRILKSDPGRDLQSGKFLARTVDLTTQALPLLDKNCKHAVWGGRAIDNNISEFKRFASRMQQSRGPGTVQSLINHGKLMLSLGMLAERTALGISRGNEPSEMAMSLFSMGCSAAQRSSMYSIKARQKTRHTTRDITLH